MLKNIVLERPLAVIDLETTGTDTKVDRIVEVSVLKVMPGGAHDHRTRRVNPGVPIPAEATAVHGISDDDVADMPTFRAIAPGLIVSLDAPPRADLHHLGSRWLCLLLAHPLIPPRGYPPYHIIYNKYQNF
jgi:hypothetical protein